MVSISNPDEPTPRQGRTRTYAPKTVIVVLGGVVWIAALYTWISVIKERRELRLEETLRVYRINAEKDHARMILTQLDWATNLENVESTLDNLEKHQYPHYPELDELWDQIGDTRAAKCAFCFLECANKGECSAENGDDCVKCVNQCAICPGPKHRDKPGERKCGCRIFKGPLTPLAVPRAGEPTS